MPCRRVPNNRTPLRVCFHMCRVLQQACTQHGVTSFDNAAPNCPFNWIPQHQRVLCWLLVPAADVATPPSVYTALWRAVRIVTVIPAVDASCSRDGARATATVHVRCTATITITTITITTTTNHSPIAGRHAVVSREERPRR